MSMKVNKNGKEYPLGFMPEHYPADRVYLDGDTSKTVQDAINKGSVYVDANSVKTYEELLNELHTKINYNKVDLNSKAVITSGTSKTVFAVQLYDNSSIKLTSSALYGANMFVKLTEMFIRVSNSIYRERYGVGNADWGDYSSQKPSNMRIAFYY